jgi:hypothetical protein
MGGGGGGVGGWRGRSSGAVMMIEMIFADFLLEKAVGFAVFVLWPAVLLYNICPVYSKYE